MPDIIGFVDGLEGAYVRGWAIAQDADPQKPRPAAITIRDPAGKPLARGLAGQNRPDLAQLGYSPACGFRVPVRRMGRAGALHVFADGIELTGSPVPVGAGLYDGALTLSGDVASGWLIERTDGFGEALVRLRDQDGALLGEALAVPDPGNPDPLFAPARFSLTLAPVCFDRTDLIVSASVENGPRFAEAHGATRLDGYLDALSPRRCGGWLLSPDAPARHLAIEVFRDGAKVGSGLCDLPREDVRDRYPHASRVGFEITLDPPLEPRTPHVYSVRLAGTEIDLFGGPFAVEDRADAIEAARRAGRQAQATPDLAPADRAVLRRALASFIGQRRNAAERTRVRVPQPVSSPVGGKRLAIVIPVYRGLEVTRACIESVLAARDPMRDVVVLVNDCSPDPYMAPLLEWFIRQPDVCVLHNATNQGFVRAANRGIAACRRGDILLLNSDTLVFPGVFEELCRIVRMSPDIGTVTPLSNNATLFSYPHASLPNAALADMGWAEVAALAREANGGVAIDVPTGHGFCLLIRREALDVAGMLDEAFGRGYGEENDFCQRVADLGFRNVAAPGAFVEHRESVSFGDEKKALVEANLARLGRMYPEYSSSIMTYERIDGMRRARWPLDAARIRKAGANGATFALVVTNWLGGGARKALSDIEAAVGYGGAHKLRLSCRADGVIELEAETPALRAVFAADETDALFDLLSAARITRILVHQVLGFPPGFIDGLANFVSGRPAIFYAHDFYPICPRVTMVDATGQFCDIAEPETCRRCIAASGAHEASRLDALTPAEHRARMGRMLAAFRHVVTPSENAATYLRRVWPDLEVTAVPHPEPARTPAAPRPAAEEEEVVLLGGIGPHKGSAMLLAVARRARLSHPDLRFRVIGHTNIDAELRVVGNVSITGAYEPREQPELLARATGRVALFLHNWPETYSYTLSEAVAAGFFPLVPDIGAPAERVRRSGWGAVFGFPIQTNEVLGAITAALARPDSPEDAPGRAAFEHKDATAAHRALLGLEEPALTPAPAPAPAPRKGARVRAN